MKKKKKQKKTIVKKIMSFFTTLFDVMRMWFKTIAWAVIMVVFGERFLPLVKTTWGARVLIIIMIFGGLWWIVGNIWSDE